MSEKYSLKQHMEAHHAGAAEHHVTMAKCEMDKCEQHNALAVAHADADQEELSACHKALAKACKAAAMEHTAEGKRHVEMAKAAATITKSMGDEMLANRGFPDGISSVIPAPQIRAIPRFGAPQEIDKVELDPRFAEMLKID